jgi:CDP-diacylglycerol--serine O-phosphatidyltransferase
MDPKPLYSTPEEAARIYLLPNFFTAGNMLCGFLSIKHCIEARFVTEVAEAATRANHYIWAVWFIVIACVFDLFDGRVARASGRQSLFGAEFDSIADTISFGMAPALMACFLLIQPGQDEDVRLATWLLAFVYLVCAGVRLARFNVLTNPLVPGNEKRASGGDFVGLPSPAAAGMVSSVVLVLAYILRDDPAGLERHRELLGWTLLPLMLLLSWLMVSNIRFPSLKAVTWNARARTMGFVLIIVTLLAAFRFKELAVPAIFGGFIFYGIYRHFFLLRQEETDPAPDDEPSE